LLLCPLDRKKHFKLIAIVANLEFRANYPQNTRTVYKAVMEQTIVRKKIFELYFAIC
jgi:hypothetical protein